MSNDGRHSRGELAGRVALVTGAIRLDPESGHELERHFTKLVNPPLQPEYQVATTVPPSIRTATHASLSLSGG